LGLVFIEYDANDSGSFERLDGLLIDPAHFAQVNQRTSLFGSVCFQMLFNQIKVFLDSNQTGSEWMLLR